MSAPWAFASPNFLDFLPISVSSGVLKTSPEEFGDWGLGDSVMRPVVGGVVARSGVVVVVVEVVVVDVDVFVGVFRVGGDSNRVVEVVVVVGSDSVEHWLREQTE